ncbi:DEKNAAC100833 [Brettanomyces naardenensis]|uniref:DEKNAAC100833 n=1 Tax=Brettanomyces naardenensis TaxID=13370 RepID=A0A448YEU1_BRENA|nr:DEKNAAC100833 [Brettanomyces naardenensis]
MSDLFDSYESDFKLAYSDAQQKENQIYGLTNQDKRVELMRGVEKSIDDCYELIESMSLEVQQLSTHERASFNAKLRTYKQDTDRLKGDLKSLMDDSDRQQLFGGNSEENYSQRQTLLKTNESIDRSTKRLNDATRTAIETENVGSSIMDTLRSQRDQITNARDTLGEADNYVDRSLRTLKTMTRRLATNKIITYGIIAVLIMLIFLVIYSKFS